jgi:hypothetical protein
MVANSLLRLVATGCPSTSFHLLGAGVEECVLVAARQVLYMVSASVLVDYWKEDRIEPLYECTTSYEGEFLLIIVILV